MNHSFFMSPFFQTVNYGVSKAVRFRMEVFFITSAKLKVIDYANVI
jgi:hypothetical protein